MPLKSLRAPNLHWRWLIVGSFLSATILAQAAVVIPFDASGQLHLPAAPSAPTSQTSQPPSIPSPNPARMLVQVILCDPKLHDVAEFNLGWPQDRGKEQVVKVNGKELGITIQSFSYSNSRSDDDATSGTASWRVVGNYQINRASAGFSVTNGLCNQGYATDGDQPLVLVTPIQSGQPLRLVPIAQWIRANWRSIDCVSSHMHPMAEDLQAQCEMLVGTSLKRADFSKIFKDNIAKKFAEAGATVGGTVSLDDSKTYALDLSKKTAVPIKDGSQITDRNAALILHMPQHTIQSNEQSRIRIAMIPKAKDVFDAIRLARQMDPSAATVGVGKNIPLGYYLVLFTADGRRDVLCITGVTSRTSRLLPFSPKTQSTTSISWYWLKQK